MPITKVTAISELYRLFLEHPFICTDSRAIKKGALFFALKGENFNGNTFAQQALQQGCAYAIIDESQYACEGTLLVQNVLQALQDLAAFHRQQLGKPVLALTGSNGKTTTKELLNAVLSKKFIVHATLGNLNNHIGVPLTLLSLKAEHDFCIVEMGANHRGEIEALCKIATPDYVMITNIGKAHLEGFGGEEGVKLGKSEIYVYAFNHGKIVFVNQDNAILTDIIEGFKSNASDAKSFNVQYYGINSFQVKMNEVLDNNAPFIQFSWVDPNGVSTTVHSKLTGAYNIENIAAAIGIGTYFNVPTASINEAIEQYFPTNNRSQFIEKGNVKIIMDAYNANPTSMVAAIDNLRTIASDHPKVVVLGDMLELGESSLKEHLTMLEKIEQGKFQQVILIGNSFAKALAHKVIANAHSFETVDALLANITPGIFANSMVLIKGSRGIHLEKVLQLI